MIGKLTSGQKIAACAVFLLIIWMLSGQFSTSNTNKNRDSEVEKPKHQSVRVIKQHASEYIDNISIHGKTVAGKTSTLKSETKGTIKTIHIRKGSTVNKGQMILEITANNLYAQLKQASSLSKQRELEYKAAISLKQKGHISERKLAEHKTMLDTALAEKAGINIQIENTKILAPFDGILDKLDVEVGDFVKAGTPIATVINFSPYKITGEITEQYLPLISHGAAATVEFLDGSQITATVAYISSSANPITKTYTVELEASEKVEDVSAGMTTKITLPLDTQLTHQIAPSLLTFNNDGEVGIKIIDEENIVLFKKVSVVKIDQNGALITGLPPYASIITVGQGYVEPGSIVDPTFIN